MTCAKFRFAQARMLSVIAEMDRRGAAAELGHKDLVQVFKHRFGWDVRTARQRIGHARLLCPTLTPTGASVAPVLPETGEAMSRGELSEEHVAVIAEVMKELPEAAEMPVVDFARQHEPRAVRAFGKELAYRLHQDDPEPADTEPALPVNRLVKRWERGRLKGWFDLDAEAGAKLAAMLDPLAAPRPDGPEGPDVRTTRERDGDALADIVGLALRSDRLPQHGGEPVQLTVTFRYEQLVEQIGHAVLDSGERISMQRVRKLACECGVVPMVLGSKSEIVDIGRQTRILTAGLRRVLTARDRGCAFPGCDRPPKHCEGHHVVPWSEGGETSIRNTVLLCRRHHDLVHHSEWEVHMVDGIPLFYPPAFLDPERKPRRNLIRAA